MTKPNLGLLLRLMKSFGWPGAVGAVLLGIAAVTSLLTVPHSQRRQAAEQQLAQLVAEQTRIDRAPSEATPERNLAEFRATLPARDQLNRSIGILHMIAGRHRLALKNGEYRTLAGNSGLGQLQITVKTSGSYQDLRAFIDEVRQTLPALALGNCKLARQRASDATLDSTLEFQLLYAST